MCGILGHINLNTEINIDCFNAMRDTLFHRGPDGKGTEVLNSGKVLFGHRRLSIIDLSEDGRQPMSNEDEKIWLTFNGEIYNYKSLRQELIESGHFFKSNTDSEVLIHGYEEWGFEKLLNRLKGMFAFAIWDEKKEQLFAARDRFGIKPFYYYRSNNQLIFASEIKAITKSKSVKTEIDETALADFFIYSYIPNPKSIWRDIWKLPPAHFLTFSKKKNKLEVKKYWDLKSFIDNKVLTTADAIQQANELILSATRDHLVSDVPVGLFLSGGYDSTTLLMHAKNIGYDISTFSIGFTNSKRSEHQQAANIASFFDSHHTNRILDEKIDILSVLRKLSYHYDEPFAVSSMIPYYLVSELASKHTKVVLTGDGGDEAFAGYSWHYHINDYFSRLNFKKLLNIFRFGKEEILIRIYDRWMTGALNATKKHQVLMPSITQRINEQGLWLYSKNCLVKENPIKAFQFLDYNTFMAEPCLTRADRSSMANSLEVRVPFLDHEIFEFIYGLKTDVYFKRGEKKFLIKENLKRNVDKEIIDGPKRGFSYQHLNTVFTDEFKDIMKRGELVKLGILKPNINFQELPKVLNFQLLMLELWFQQYN